MRSARTKVLHTVGGTPMLGRVLAAARAAGAAHSHLVLGHGADEVRRWLVTQPGEMPSIALQARQLGTAHAVQQALPPIPDAAMVVVLYGDVPLVTPATLAALVDAAQSGLAVVSAEVTQPQGYGRILRDASGCITGIVEEKDASPAQRQIREINSGLLAAPAARLKHWLAKVGSDNAGGEFYLTDVIGLAAADGVNVVAVLADAEEVAGVNDPAQLAAAERRLQARQAQALLREGLYLVDPARFDLRGTLAFGRDVHIDVGCVLEGAVELGDGVRLGPYCVLRDVRLGAGTEVRAYSWLESTRGGTACIVGPYARLRPGTTLGDAVHIGNFVEVKQSRLGDGAKANHLAYIGDAEVGARSNIGAGVITCNFDGTDKHRTVIGDDAFIGSDSQLIAPVTVGAGAYVAAGSTITEDVPADALAICRAREQKIVPGWKPRIKR